MDYRGVLGVNSVEIIVSKSRFIATCTNVSNSEEAIEFIREISKRYSDATHNCYGYIANPEMTEMKFSDDGEPQGTAGQPILEVLRKKKLACSAVVVTRYFGGIKLGTGGLVAAYTKAAKECIESASIASFLLSDYCIAVADYSNKNRIVQAIENNGGEVYNINYMNEVVINYVVPEYLTATVSKAIISTTSGKIIPTSDKKDYYIYK